MRVLTISAGRVTIDRARRMIFGTLFHYGEVGHTTGGALRVDVPGAITPPDNLPDVEMTREHSNVVRGHLAQLDDDGRRVYVGLRVVDGPEGDRALDEADPANPDRTRAGLSFVVSDAEIVPTTDAGVDGVIAAARLYRIGQVADPAFNSARVDRIAASRTASAVTTTGGNMTAEQRARLAELIAQQNLTDAERAELDELTQLAVAEAAQPDDPPAEDPPAEDPPAAPAPTAAAVAASRRRPQPVPSGVPRRRGQAQGQEGAYARFCETVVNALRPGGGGLRTIEAAFTDVTDATVVGTEAPAWSGELWSGLQFTPEWTNLFSQGDLTSWEGSGWRWVTKPVMADYAGGKADVPSAALATEPGGYEAARMACGHDIDRKFYDFPGGAAFLQSYGEAAREDWAVKLDAKVRAYAIANAVAYGAATTSLLKAAALAMFGVKRKTKAKATWVAVNEDDFLGLLDVSNFDMPAFLDAFGVDPKNFVVDPGGVGGVPAGTVLSGVKQAATVRTLPGSPIRVDAQHLAQGGVDSAFFGYWAIEEHHTEGVVKTTFA